MKLVAVGDIFLNTKSDRHPFEAVTPLLADNDVLFGNLEVALTRREVAAEKSVPLIGSPDRIQYLKEAGFGIVSIANNHVLDAGVGGFDDTLRVLADNGISFVGGSNETYSGSDVVLECQGVKLGFLAYYIRGRVLDNGRVSINRLNERSVIDDIKSLKEKCHHVIVSLHWGTEKSFYPSPEQIKTARSLIDNGASIILGHHPHVIQGIELYNRGLIAYSLGNFQFLLNPTDLPPNKDRRTNRSIILRINLTEDAVDSYDVTPVIIDDDFVPRECNREEKEEILSFLSEISEPITQGGVSSLAWYGHVADVYLSETWRSFVVRIRKYGIFHLCIFLVWLVSPFVLKCYAGWIWRKLRGRRAAGEFL